MKTQTIKDYRNSHILYEGVFETLARALEQAVRDHVSLEYADLSGASLVNASLDGAQLPRARFRGANLLGANLSEAVMDGSDFSGAGLQNSCLCFSSLQNCDFEGVFFGATDIAACDIRASRFAGPSALLLSFTETARMEDCLYEGWAMSRPPFVLQGLPRLVACLDEAVMIGTEIRPLADLACSANDNNSEKDIACSLLPTLLDLYSKRNLLPRIKSRQSKYS